MWHPAVGLAEIVLLGIVALLLWLSGKHGRRLAPGIIPCFVLAAVTTPSDPLSMLIVGIPLSMALVCGVVFAPYLRASDSEPSA